MNKEELVSIPQYIADYLKSTKDTVSLYGAIKHTEGNKQVDSWMTSPVNQETFALAWINGYTIEKEKKYLVSINGISSGSRYLKHNLDGDSWYFGNLQEIPYIIVKHTRSDLERFEDGGVFDNPMFTVEEIK